jgi:HEAT repeat protein/beta-lactamase regulating signal transducer with metallopeptidase domain
MTMLELTELVRAASPALVGWLLTYALHSTILLGAAWLLAGRAKSHPVREVIWKTALFGGFITATGQTLLAVDPLAGRVTVPAASPVARAEPEPVASFEDASGALAARSTELESPSGSQPAASLPRSAPKLTGRTLVVLSWAGMAVALLGLYGLQRKLFARRIAGRRPVMTHPLAEMLEILSAEVGIVRPIRLTASPALASPVALGSSEIAIPEAALTDLDPDQQRGMLAHELAHLERRDPAWLTAACLAERIAFFQPLNRLARRRMQESAEYLCDEWAVRRTGSGVFLAKCLAKVAEWMDASPRAVPVAGMAEERSHLVARVRRLLDATPFPAAPGRRLLAAASVSTVLIALLAVPGVSLARHQSNPGPTAIPEQSDQSDHDEDAGRPSSPSQDSTRAVIRALLEAVRDPDLEVRRAAIRSLGRYEDPSTAPAFREALRDPDHEIRYAAIEALAELKDRSSVAAIAAALSDDHVEVRRAAADALDDLPAAGARTQLIAALKDPDGEVRANVISALARLKDPSATEALVAAMKDPKPDVRARAIEALHELELPTPPSGLLDALRDPVAAVRHQAAHAVGHYQDARAVPSLRTMLDDSNAEVREAAVEALSEIRTEAAIEALMGALKSKDPKVRRAAADALGQR